MAANGPSKNSGSRKMLVQFNGSRSLVLLAVMYVSLSGFLYKGVFEARFFSRLRVSKSWIICLSSLNIEN